MSARKKGPLAMSKRPKSREETPKEGSDSARRYRTATICGRAAQSASAFESFSVQKTTNPSPDAKKSHSLFVSCFQQAGWQTAAAALPAISLVVDLANS